MKQGKFLVLVGIILIGALLRLLWLNKFPAGFTPDEASFGYNAYSLLKTGKDEWGIPFWQLPYNNLRSFGDYKMPLYAILTVPSVAVFGLNEFSTRLPNALLGSLTVLVIYALVIRTTNSKLYAEFAALLIALSPWAIPLSRGAFEANLITFFLTLATVLFFSHRFAISYALFALCLYTYHSSRIIVPLALFSLFIIFKPKISKSLLLLLISLPAIYSFIFFNQRALDVSIFHPDDNFAAMASRRLELINSGWPAPAAKLISNKLNNALPVFFSNYISYFTPKFLFSNGPAEATYGMLPDHGVLYWVQLPVILLFMYKVIKKSNHYELFAICLLLISPIPAALSKGPGFAANRAAFMIIPLTIITTIGMAQLVKFTTKYLLFAFILLLFVSGSIYIQKYVTKSSIVHSRSMGFGYKSLSLYLNEAIPQFDQIRVSRLLSESQAYYAFYAKYPPRDFQSATRSWTQFENLGFRFLDQYDGYFLGNIRFGDLNLERHDKGKILYIGRPDDFPKNTNYQIISAYPDSTPAIVSLFP
jgi:4-amino-4-deoxy-L-arabinose transferase-like glycosyltransferase